MAVDASGNIIVANYDVTGAAYAAKYDATDGYLLWEHHFCGSCAEIGFVLGDTLTGVVVDGTRNIIVAGFATRGQYPGNCDF